MWLDCGEHGVVPLSRVRRRSVVARTSRNIPPCLAALVITVDGRLSRTLVNLTSGFTEGRRAARVLTVDALDPVARV